MSERQYPEYKNHLFNVKLYRLTINGPSSSLLNRAKRNNFFDRWCAVVFLKPSEKTNRLAPRRRWVTWLFFLETEKRIPPWRWVKEQEMVDLASFQKNHSCGFFESKRRDGSTYQIQDSPRDPSTEKMGGFVKVGD